MLAPSFAPLLSLLLSNLSSAPGLIRGLPTCCCGLDGVLMVRPSVMRGALQLLSYGTVSKISHK